MNVIDNIKTLFGKKAEKEKFCNFPFFNLMVTAGGDYKPCCKYNDNLTDKGQPLHASKNTMEQAWGSDSMQALRQAFIDGKQPTGCKQCWDEEESGIKSMRYDGFEFDMSNSQIDKPAAAGPMRMDLYPSNVCNLKCRICGPAYSTKWISEAKERMNVNEDVHINLTEKNIAFIDKWLPNIKEFGLFGGEPFYMNETKTLLQKCVDRGYSKNIKLLINTNATIYSDEWIALLKQFKKVWLNFSVDDLEGRFEYQRKGANWKNAEANITQFVKQSGFTWKDQLETKICCTVSSYNVYYLPEFFSWLNNKYPGMPVFFNLLHEPDYLCIKNLPDELKDIVENRLQTIGKKTFKLEAQRTRTIKNIIRFMHSKSDLSFQQFMVEVGKGDAYRNEKYESVFPEFWMHIEKYSKQKLSIG